MIGCAEVHFQPAAGGRDTGMLCRKAAKQQSAEAVRGRAAIRKITLPPLTVTAGHAGLVAYAVVINEEESAIVKSLFFTEVLTVFHKALRFLDGRIVRRE